MLGLTSLLKKTAIKYSGRIPQMHGGISIDWSQNEKKCEFEVLTLVVFILSPGVFNVDNGSMAQYEIN